MKARTLRDPLAALARFAICALLMQRHCAAAFP